MLLFGRSGRKGEALRERLRWGKGGESCFPFSANMNAGAKAGFKYRRLWIMSESVMDIDALVTISEFRVWIR